MSKETLAKAAYCFIVLILLASFAPRNAEGQARSRSSPHRSVSDSSNSSSDNQRARSSSRAVSRSHSQNSSSRTSAPTVVRPQSSRPMRTAPPVTVQRPSRNSSSSSSSRSSRSAIQPQNTRPSRTTSSATVQRPSNRTTNNSYSRSSSRSLTKPSTSSRPVRNAPAATVRRPTQPSRESNRNSSTVIRPSTTRPMRTAPPVTVQRPSRNSNSDINSSRNRSSTIIRSTPSVSQSRDIRNRNSDTQSRRPTISSTRPSSVRNSQERNERAATLRRDRNSSITLSPSNNTIQRSRVSPSSDGNGISQRGRSNSSIIRNSRPTNRTITDPRSLANSSENINSPAPSTRRPAGPQRNQRVTGSTFRDRSDLTERISGVSNIYRQNRSEARDTYRHNRREATVYAYSNREAQRQRATSGFLYERLSGKKFDSHSNHIRHHAWRGNIKHGYSKRLNYDWAYRHHHGAILGHYHYRNRWYVYPRKYYTRYRRDSFYFFIDLGTCESRNLPYHVYEKHIYYDRDAVDVFEAEDATSRAYAAFAEGRFYGSVLAFNDAIEEDPENGILYLARAHANFAIKDYRAAYEDLIQGMHYVPEWVDVDMSIVELYGDPEIFMMHYEALEKWVIDYPRDYKAHFVLGYIHYFQQDYASAKDELVYTLAWEEDHKQANELMERILQNEAEQEVNTAEVE